MIVTPHMASVASSETIGLQVAQNVRRLVSGEPLLNVADVARGYYSRRLGVLRIDESVQRIEERAFRCAELPVAGPEQVDVEGGYALVGRQPLEATVVRTLNDHGIETEKPIEIVVWPNEEGARFTPAMLGSAAFTGAMSLDQALDARDAQGVSVADALAAASYAGERAIPGAVFDSTSKRISNGGPALEESGVPIGVVTGGQAICWLDVRVCGQAAHAGTTPMPFGREALFGGAEIAAALEAIAAEFAPQGLVTIGELSIRNSSRNTVAGTCRPPSICVIPTNRYRDVTRWR
jgi:beta-ureidopropionase / N-carbamoyl-L-amino-acid hydrolase